VCALTVVGLDTEFDESRVAGLRRRLRASADELERLLTRSTDAEDGAV
jgi:DNA-binding IclR family transcriptional regulator